MQRKHEDIIALSQHCIGMNHKHTAPWIWLFYQQVTQVRGVRPFSVIVIPPEFEVDSFFHERPPHPNITCPWKRPLRVKTSLHRQSRDNSNLDHKRRLCHDIRVMRVPRSTPPKIIARPMRTIWSARNTFRRQSALRLRKPGICLYYAVVALQYILIGQHGRKCWASKCLRCFKRTWLRIFHIDFTITLRIVSSFHFTRRNSDGGSLTTRTFSTFPFFLLPTSELSASTTR